MSASKITLENSTQKNNKQVHNNDTKNNNSTDQELAPIEHEQNKNETNNHLSIDNDIANSSNQQTTVNAKSINNGSSLSFGLPKKQLQNIQFNNTYSSSETLLTLNNSMEEDINYIPTQKFVGQDT